MTPTDDIKHFLITLDPNKRKTTVEEFNADYDAAQDAYQKAERQAWGTNLDVVLLSSDSLDTIKRTHSSYFDDEPNIVGGAIGGVIEATLGGPVGAALGAGMGGLLGHESEKDTREKASRPQIRLPDYARY